DGCSASSVCARHADLSASALLDDLLNELPDLSQGEWLRHGGDARPLEKLSRFLAQRIPGEEGDARKKFRMVTLQLHVEAGTIGVRHPHITQDEVIRPMAQLFQGDHAAADDLRLMAVNLE